MGKGPLGFIIAVGSGALKMLGVKGGDLATPGLRTWAQPVWVQWLLSPARLGTEGGPEPALGPTWISAVRTTNAPSTQVPAGPASRPAFAFPGRADWERRAGFTPQSAGCLRNGARGSVAGTVPGAGRLCSGGCCPWYLGPRAVAVAFSPVASLWTALCCYVPGWPGGDIRGCGVGWTQGCGLPAGP